MSTAKAWAVSLNGTLGTVIEVEAATSNQTPGMSLIGLPDKALNEATRRVQNATKSVALELPRQHVTVNLSPASVPKSGSGFDVAIALAVIATTGVIDRDSVASMVHLGELGLDGRVRAIPGVLPATLAARQAGFTRIAVPPECVAEAELVEGIWVQPIETLAHAARLHGADVEDPVLLDRAQVPDPVPRPREPHDLDEVVGQEPAVEALIAAAAGGHHMLMSGPPGAGKTMLASRLPGILPELSDEDAVEVASIKSLSGERVTTLTRIAPFEAPHHSASTASLIGGGTRGIRPGAIARAHKGVLFLDEAAEFPRAALDALRQPLESGHIEIHRAHSVAVFPSRFQLVLATNPCPCGQFGVRGGECTCPSSTVRRYSDRISGPLRDRIDIELRLSRVSSPEAFDGARGAVSSADARARVVAARERSATRWAATDWRLNAEIPGPYLRQGPHRIPARALAPLARALDIGALTLRGYDRVLRLAWTLADLDAAEAPSLEHVAQALILRKGNIT